MKQALLFYAKKDNYLFFKNKDAPIALDEGTQAKYALEQLKIVEAANQEINEEYTKYLSEKTDKTETPEGILNLIKEIKEADDGDV